MVFGKPKIEDVRIVIPEAKKGSLRTHLCDDGRAKIEVKIKGEWELLFRYYPDELNFGPEEFSGLTVDEAHALFTRKDVAYLRS